MAIDYRRFLVRMLGTMRILASLAVFIGVAGAQPALAQVDQFLGRGRNCLHAWVVRRFLTRRPGEGEGLESRGGRVAKATLKLTYLRTST